MLPRYIPIIPSPLYPHYLRNNRLYNLTLISQYRVEFIFCWSFFVLDFVSFTCFTYILENNILRERFHCFLLSYLWSKHSSIAFMNMANQCVLTTRKPRALWWSLFLSHGIVEVRERTLYIIIAFNTDVYLYLRTFKERGCEDPLTIDHVNKRHLLY